MPLASRVLQSAVSLISSATVIPSPVQFFNSQATLSVGSSECVAMTMTWKVMLNRMDDDDTFNTARSTSSSENLSIKLARGLQQVSEIARPREAEDAEETGAQVTSLTRSSPHVDVNLDSEETQEASTSQGYALPTPVQASSTYVPPCTIRNLLSCFECSWKLVPVDLHLNNLPGLCKGPHWRTPEREEEEGDKEWHCDKGGSVE